MVRAETILEKAIEVDAQMIGLSGLITPSLHEMAHVATNVHHGPLFCQEMTRLAAMAAPLGPTNIAAYVTSPS